MSSCKPCAKCAHVEAQSLAYIKLLNLLTRVDNCCSGKVINVNVGVTY